MWVSRCILQGPLWGRDGSALRRLEVPCEGARSLSDVEGWRLAILEGEGI